MTVKNKEEAMKALQEIIDAPTPLARQEVIETLKTTEPALETQRDEVATPLPKWGVAVMAHFATIHNTKTL